MINRWDARDSARRLRAGACRGAAQTSGVCEGRLADAVTGQRPPVRNVVRRPLLPCRHSRRPLAEACGSSQRLASAASGQCSTRTQRIHTQDATACSDLHAGFELERSALSGHR